jgi:mannose-6-phosphate isomerase-like protein (cupin superfamily)
MIAHAVQHAPGWDTPRMKGRPLLPGDVVEQATTDERVVFHETATSSGGAAVAATIRFHPTGPVAARHLHPRQTEMHELVSGELRLAFPGHDGALQIGRPVTVPAGAPHRIWNDSGDMVELLVEARPALRTDEFLAALLRLRPPRPRGQWNPLRLAAIASEFPDESHLAGVHPRLQHAVVASLLPLARRRYPL